MKHDLLELIDKGIALNEKAKPQREYLGGSFVGEPCARKIQYKSKATEVDEDRVLNPRIYRIFDRGHLGEDLVAKYLRQAGLILKTEKQDGSQFGFSQMKGMFKGHIDGLILGAKDDIQLDFKVPCIWENKVLNNQSFNHTKKHGIKKSKPLYYAQAQIYIYYLDTEKNPALFTFVNADTMEIAYEIIPYDGVAVVELLNKAETVIRANISGEELPRGTDDKDGFMCRFCDYKSRCWT